MFDFLRKQTVGPLPGAVRLSLSQQRNVSEQTALGLKMVHQGGLYSGRKVTYFRVFNPAALGTQPRQFADLAGAGVLYSGHIEREGHVVLSR